MTGMLLTKGEPQTLGGDGYEVPRPAWFSDELLDYLKEAEGFDPTSYSSPEGGTNTIGIGRKLTLEEQKAGSLLINGKPFNFKHRVSVENAEAIALESTIEAFKKMSVAPEDLNATQIMYLVSMQFIQGKPLDKVVPKFLAAVLAEDYTTALQQTQDVYWTDKNGKRHSHVTRWKKLASDTDTQVNYDEADVNPLPNSLWEGHHEQRQGEFNMKGIEEREDFAQYTSEKNQAYNDSTEEEKNNFKYLSFDVWKLKKPAPVSRYTEETGGVHTQTPKTFAQYTSEKNQAYADSTEEEKNNFNYLSFDDWKRELPPSGLPLAPETSGEPEGDRVKMNIPNLMKERQNNKTKEDGEIQLAAIMEKEGEDFDLFSWLYKTAKEKLIDPISDLGQKVLGVLEGGAQDGLDVLVEVFNQDSAAYRYGVRGGPKGKGASKNSPRGMTLDNMSPQEMSKIQMRMQAEAPNKQEDEEFLLAQAELEAQINEQQ